MERDARILIVGGGFGGRAAAAFLRQSGYAVTVASEAPGGDGGVLVGSNGARILALLGEGVLAAGVRLAGAETHDHRGQSVAREDQAPHGPVGIARSTLVEALRGAAEGVAERQGVRAVELGGDGVRVVDAEGEARYDLVVVADGARSSARALLWPDAPLSESGDSLVRFEAQIASDDTRGGTVLGQGVTLIHHPIDGGRRAVTLVVSAGLGEAGAGALRDAVGPAGEALFAAMEESTQVQHEARALRTRETVRPFKGRDAASLERLVETGVLSPRRAVGSRPASTRRCARCATSWAWRPSSSTGCFAPRSSRRGDR